MAYKQGLLIGVTNHFLNGMILQVEGIHFHWEVTHKKIEEGDAVNLVQKSG